MARNLKFYRERERETETETQREGGVRFRKKSSTQCLLAGWLSWNEINFFVGFVSILFYQGS
jgi:hypothetical protein